MKIEEALEQFEKHDLRDSLGFCDENDVDAHKLAVNALKFMEKYKWHDIKKIPTDLPKKDGLYTVIFEDEPQENYNYEGYTRYFSLKHGWCCECYIEHRELPECPKEYYLEDVDGTVIAWKNIHPFVDCEYGEEYV